MSIDTDSIKRKYPLPDYLRSLGVMLKPASGGRELVGKCSFCEDRSGHLYINPANEVFHCKKCGAKGRDVIGFVRKLHNLGFKEACARITGEREGGDGLNGNGNHPEPSRKEVCSYPYQNAKGEVIYEIARFELAGGGKDFVMRQPNGTWNVQGIPRVLYHLPEVVEAREVWLTEGEKDADNLRKCGLVASTNAGGGNAPWLESYSEALKGKRIVLCGDQDQVGQEHVAKLAHALSEVADSLRIIKLPEEFKDVSELLESLPSDFERIETLEKLRLEAQVCGLPPMESGLDFEEEEIESPKEIIEGVLHQGSKIAFGGASKSFKTWIMLDLAISVSSGTPWLGFEVEQGKVLYLNFELQRKFMQERARMIYRKMGIKAQKDLIFWNLRGHANSADVILPQVSRRAKREGFSLIVVDPIYKLLGGNDENSSRDMLRIMNEIERLTLSTGAAVCFGAHYAKGNASEKESIDRISGSGVFARDPDSLVMFTTHRNEGSYTVEMTLRNFAQQPPFVVRWVPPRMELDSKADPGDLKRAKGAGGRPKEWSAERVVGFLQGKSLSTEEWYKEVCRQVEEEGYTPPSKPTFLKAKDEAYTKELVTYCHSDKTYVRR